MLRQSLLISKNVLSNSNLKLAPTSFTHSIKSFHSIRSISFQSTNKSTFSSSFISSSSSFSRSRFSTSSSTSFSTSSTASTPNKPSKAGKKSSILTIGTLLLGTSISYYIYSNFLIENTNNQISNQHFIPLKVIKIETLTKDTKKFTLNLPDELIPKIEEVSNDPIRSVYIMQPDINVQRAYTVCFSLPLDLSFYTKLTLEHFLGLKFRFIHQRKWKERIGIDNKTLSRWGSFEMDA